MGKAGVIITSCSSHRPLLPSDGFQILGQKWVYSLCSVQLVCHDEARQLEHRIVRHNQRIGSGRIVLHC
jgi:hypothetical protein